MSRIRPHTTEAHLQAILDFLDSTNVRDCPYCLKYSEDEWLGNHLPDCIFEEARKWQELVLAIRDRVSRELRED